MLSGLLRTYLRPYRASVALLVGLQLIQTITFLLLPRLNAKIVDDGIVHGSLVDIGWIGGVMLVVAALQMASRLGAQ